MDADDPQQPATKADLAAAVAVLLANLDAARNAILDQLPTSPDYLRRELARTQAQLQEIAGRVFTRPPEDD